jgi:hypothetical protein
MSMNYSPDNHSVDFQVSPRSSMSTGPGSWEATTVPKSRFGTMNRSGEGARTVRTVLSARSVEWVRADEDVRGPGDPRIHAAQSSNRFVRPL